MTLVMCPPERTRRRDPIERLTLRERQVLALMAEGRTNPAIARSLFVTDKAIEKHVGNIFTKLDLFPAGEDHRRVMAVLHWAASTRRPDGDVWQPSDELARRRPDHPVVNAQLRGTS